MTRCVSPRRRRSSLRLSRALGPAVAALGLLVGSIPGKAAEFSLTLVATPAGQARYLAIDGDIRQGDWSKFSRLIRHNPEIAGVVLRSNGGSADDGLAIANQVFERGLPTMVTGTCHSVCSVIFLAGRERYITAGAQLTVHSAYRQVGDWAVEDDGTNATVAWFLGHMGYPLALARLWLATPSAAVAPITLDMNAKWQLGFTVIPEFATTVAQK